MIGMFSVMHGNSVFSSVLAMGMIVAYFQRWGIVLVFRAVLYMFVRYLMASDSSV